MQTTLRGGCLAALLLVLVPGALWAQTTPQSSQSSQGWPGLDTSRLSTVYVRDNTGVETTGKLLRFDPDSLVILVNGSERRFDAAMVRRVERRDSVRNGLIIGTIGGVLFATAAAGLSDCPEDPGGSCPGFRTTVFLLHTGVWAGIGTGIDALIPGRTTLYDARTARALPGLDRLAVTLLPGHIALGARFKW